MTESNHLKLAAGGERMIPEVTDRVTFWEHIYRYRFAARFVQGRLVLDIACGEGYGTAALRAAGAACVVGIDITEEVCRHAQRRYGICALVGSATNVPLTDNSLDAIVSFETIEHVARSDSFLNECVRVLRPGGLLIISTPNREVYSEFGKHNPHHVSELNTDEFLSLLTPRFKRVQLYSQRPKTAGWWSARSLAADNSPWLRVRGFWRLRKILRSSFLSHVYGREDPATRQSTAETILNTDRVLSAVVNPYPVRRWMSGNRERPTFLIAVAQA